MPKPVISTASTTWNGDLFTGSGKTTVSSGALETFDVSWKTRAGEAGGQTTPEELIAAAHASCYSMALSNELASAGTPPVRVETSAAVTFVAGEGITGIVLSVSAEVPDITPEAFATIAEAAKVGCPISQALASVPISLEATLA